MNTRLLRRVARAIVQHPTQFDIRYWFHSVDSTDRQAGGCGTAACIGGWVAYLVRKDKKLADSRAALYSTMTTGAVARNALGIDYDTSALLFHLCNWPTLFKAGYKQRKTALAKARIAAKRIDHFIKTKGEE